MHVHSWGQVTLFGLLVSSILFIFHLTRKLQGIGLFWGQKAVSQGQGYLPMRSGLLPGHGPTGGDAL